MIENILLAAIIIHAVLFIAWAFFISLAETSQFHWWPIHKDRKFMGWLPVWYPKDFWHHMKNFGIASFYISLVCGFTAFGVKLLLIYYQGGSYIKLIMEYSLMEIGLFLLYALIHSSLLKDGRKAKKDRLEAK